jgi:hypothetical protein
VASVIECLSSKCEALSSNPNTSKEWGWERVENGYFMKGLRRSPKVERTDKGGTIKLL